MVRPVACPLSCCCQLAFVKVRERSNHDNPLVQKAPEDSFFPSATSEGFSLCRSTAGAELRVPAFAAALLPEVWAELRAGCRRVENLGKPTENRHF